MRIPAKLFGIAALLYLSPAISHAQPPAGTDSGNVQGRVYDAESQAPLNLVQVVLTGTPHKALSDAEGRFAFRGVAAGAYAVRATRMGYKPLVRDPVVVAAGERLVLDLGLTPHVIQLEEINVTPGAYSFMSTAPSARQTMTREDIESVPQLGEDVFRAVNRLPGLSSGDYSAHFSVRGGRHDETLILLDGLELFEPYHLKDFNEGAISIVDVDAIDDVQLMTGGFPAQFGNKRSGVFDIESRTPEMDHARVNVAASFMNARTLARGPLWNKKGSWLTSARSGYMDLVFGIIGQNQLPSPRYHDVFSKLTMELGPRHTLSFDLLHAADRYTFDAPSTTGFNDTLDTREHAKNRYGNSYVWSTLASTLGSRVAVKSMVSASLVSRRRDGSESYVHIPQPVYTVTNDRDYSILGLKQDWTLGLSDAYVLSTGFDLRELHNKDAYRSVVTQDPNDPTIDTTGAYPVFTNTSIEKRGTKLGAYVSNKWKVLDPLVLELGARYDRASYTGDRDWSPRASAALRLGRGRTLRLGWGHYRQIQGIDEVSALNADRRYFRSELSKQVTAGLEQVFDNGALLRLEGYYKEGSNLRPVYRNWKGGIDAFPEVNEDRILVFPRRSMGRGLELFYDKKLGERVKVRGGYAYSIAEEEVDRMVNVNTPELLVFDPKHPIPQDQRHAVNLDMTYKFRTVWTLNSSFAFHSGWPATHERLISTIDEDRELNYAVLPEKIYGERLPSYYRLDTRATRRWNTAHGEMRFFVELVNLTNHENVFGYDYFKMYDANRTIVLDRSAETWFTLLPSAGVVWSRTF